MIPIIAVSYNLILTNNKYESEFVKLVIYLLHFNCPTNHRKTGHINVVWCIEIDSQYGNCVRKLFFLVLRMKA